MFATSGKTLGGFGALSINCCSWFQDPFFLGIPNWTRYHIAFVVADTWFSLFSASKECETGISRNVPVIPVHSVCKKNLTQMGWNVMFEGLNFFPFGGLNSWSNSSLLGKLMQIDSQYNLGMSEFSKQILWLPGSFSVSLNMVHHKTRRQCLDLNVDLLQPISDLSCHMSLGCAKHISILTVIQCRGPDASGCETGDFPGRWAVSVGTSCFFSIFFWAIHFRTSSAWNASRRIMWVSRTHRRMIFHVK